MDLCLARTEAERRQATYAQVKEYILNEFGLKVSSLYIAQVKKKCGIETGENITKSWIESLKIYLYDDVSVGI